MLILKSYLLQSVLMCISCFFIVPTIMLFTNAAIACM